MGSPKSLMPPMTDEPRRYEKRMPPLRLPVPVFAQREAECGNTSLKAVCWYHRRRLSARYLGKLANLDSNGIDHADLVTAARKTGAAVTAGDGGTIRQLRAALVRGLPPIVGWWSMDREDEHFDPRWPVSQRRENDCGHYSVVCGMDDARIQLMDPQWETRRGVYRVIGRRWMPIHDFLRVWYDTATHRYVRVSRWYMIASYPTKARG